MNRQKTQTARTQKTSSIKESAENADLHKRKLNKIMTTHE